MHELLARILAFAEAHPAVRAVILTGSRARDVAPADALSDLDVEIYCADRSLFADLDRWLAAQPDVWVDLDPERDSAAFDRGAPPAPGRPPPRQPPSPEELRTLVEEYWFEAYHVAKYLARDDLWPARFRDWNTKQLLLKAIEWHARSRRGWELDTWHLGIRHREWAEPWVSERLPEAFGRADAADAWRALDASSELFRAVASETAARLGYPYPADVDRAIAGYIAHLRDGAAGPAPAADVVVRRARLDDRDAIRALQADLDRAHAAALPDVLVPDPEDDDDFAEAVADEARCFLAVAEQGGEVVGYVDASWHEPDEPTELVRPWCRINNLAVSADHRRRGVATALVRATERWARQRGLPDVRLDVYEFNVAAWRLYERLGYSTYRRQMRRFFGS